MRRLISVLSVVVVTSGGAAVAQNKNDKKAPAPVAPAKEPVPASAPAGDAAAAGSASGDAVAPIEDAPPSDMEGTNENPDNPHGTGDTVSVVATPTLTKPTGYPIEEALRPITLPANMAEVSIAPHFQASPIAESDALRARYGITPKVQLGLTYVYGGIYDDPMTVATSKKGFHVGKAAGLDVTVLVTNWLGVRVGVPVYFDPFALSIAAGAPMKFVFGNKLAIGGMDDLLNVTVKRFAPSFYQEAYNAQGAANDMSNTEQSRGRLRFSGFVDYQQSPQLAIIGRVGLDTDLGAGGGGAAGTSTPSATQTFIHGGIQYSPKKFLDVGATAGFDDLSKSGSFGLQGILAVRI